MGKITLSASALDNFKSCPIRWRNSNLWRLRRTEDSDSQRRGTTWHKLQELQKDMDALTKYINEQYEVVPEYKTKEEWETERVILLYSMAGHNWYYQQQKDEFEVIASEIEFEIELADGVILRGKIDQLVQDKFGNLYIREFKSSAKSLDDSYWDHLNLDVQVNTYVLAVNSMMQNGELEKYGISKDHPLITRILYNVWHKPGIGPKFLTQKASKELVSTRVYCDAEFELEKFQDESAGIEIPAAVFGLHINGVKVITEPGKKTGTFAIYETPEMFGARLLQDIVERPEFYFQQKELSRTSEEMEAFQAELYNTYRMMQYQAENEFWYPNDKQCRSRFKCEYVSLCDYNVEIDLENPPEGFNVQEEK